MKIIKADHSVIDRVAYLFNEYRIFYDQDSDIEMSKEFLLERMKNEESTIFVVIKDNSSVGFVQIYPGFSSVSCRKDYILNDLFVLPEYRGQGIASKLLERSKEYAIENNGKGLALETAKDNPARELYERLDWRADNDFIHYYWKSNS